MSLAVGAWILGYLPMYAAAATCATHLSRLGAELVLWSSEEFGFVGTPIVINQKPREKRKR